jgi:hypothetical protein
MHAPDVFITMWYDTTAGLIEPEKTFISKLWIGNIFDVFSMFFRFFRIIYIFLIILEYIFLN